MQASLRESENKLSEVFLILTNLGSGRNGETARSGPDIQQVLAIDRILGSEETVFVCGFVGTVKVLIRLILDES